MREGFALMKIIMLGTKFADQRVENGVMTVHVFAVRKVRRVCF